MLKIRDLLKSGNISQEEVMKSLDIKSRSTISLKINGKAEFSAKEALILKDLINERNGSNYTLEELFSLERSE